MGGVLVTRTTSDGLHNDGSNATKHYVDANIVISPLSPVNEVGSAEVFTITVTALPDTAAGTPSFALPTVTFPGGAPGPVGAVIPVSTVGNVATYTVTINNPTVGAFTVQASDVITMGGVAVTRATSDGLHNDGSNATKHYVDANIVISPLSPVNEVGSAEVFTITV